MKFCRSAIILLLLSSLGLVPLSAQPTDPRVQLANLTQDLALLSQQVGQLRLEVEDLRRENRTLRQNLARQSGVVEQLQGVSASVDQRLLGLRRDLLSADDKSKAEIIGEVSKQIERLAKQTQSALDALARSSNVQADLPPEPVNFSDDFPKENGVLYEVQPGDTLSEIARKLGSTVRDIQNANRIADPRALKVGQTLFVPRR